MGSLLLLKTPDSGRGGSDLAVMVMDHFNAGHDLLIAATSKFSVFATDGSLKGTADPVPPFYQALRIGIIERGISLVRRGFCSESECCSWHQRVQAITRER